MNTKYVTMVLATTTLSLSLCFQGINAQFSQTTSEDLRSKWQFPDNPLGRRTSALLEALERNDEAYTRQFIHDAYAQDLRNDYPMSEHLAWFTQRSKDLEGPFRAGGVVMPSPYHVEVGLRSGKTEKLFTLIVEIEQKEPYLITGLGFESVADAAKEYEHVDLSKVDILNEFEEFKQIFNNDSNYVRIVTILSPT